MIIKIQKYSFGKSFHHFRCWHDESALAAQANEEYGLLASFMPTDDCEKEPCEDQTLFDGFFENGGAALLALGYAKLSVWEGLSLNLAVYYS